MALHEHFAEWLRDELLSEAFVKTLLPYVFLVIAFNFFATIVALWLVLWLKKL